MNRVTIDDPITRVFDKHLSLETVERVDRDVFYTSVSSITLEHAAEGVTWLRGYHLPDSEQVLAARAARALSPVPPIDMTMADRLEPRSILEAMYRDHRSSLALPGPAPALPAGVPQPVTHPGYLQRKHGV